jgi:hypothetical protein
MELSNEFAPAGPLSVNPSEGIISNAGFKLSLIMEPYPLLELRNAIFVAQKTKKLQPWPSSSSISSLVSLSCGFPPRKCEK